MLMRSKMTHTWLKAALAMSVLGSGAAWAEGAQATREAQVSHPKAQVVRSLDSGGTRLEVTSAQGFESGAWVLVVPRDEGASRPWTLAQVRSADARSLELSRSASGLQRTGGAQAELLSVRQEIEGSATAWLDKPLQGARVPGGALSVEGQAPSGSQVLLFVDGVEAARLEADDSGRFAGTPEKPLAAGSHQFQVVSGFESTWCLQPESVSVVSLAPPATPTVLEPADGAFTNDTTPLFRGTAEAGTQVIVSLSGSDVASTTADSAGNWSLSLTTPLAEGAYTASVRAQSTSGETSGTFDVGFTVDVTPPHARFTQFPPGFTASTTATFRF
jgi:hypothetical protein